MRFVPLPLQGAHLVALERHDDERGFFARVWSSKEFRDRGLAPELAETSFSYNPGKGTLRGLHYQLAPRAEAKLVTCVRGSIWDVMVDLRETSATYLGWHGQELGGGSLDSIYVPEGIAHGFLTLSDEVLVAYQISERHDPSLARGVRWDDPVFGVRWPAAPVLMSARDQSYPYLDATALAERRKRADR